MVSVYKASIFRNLEQKPNRIDTINGNQIYTKYILKLRASALTYIIAVGKD